MSGPFAITSSIPAPGSPPAPAHIDCGRFWPAVDLDHLRKAIRIDQAVTPERLIDVVENAALDIMAELDGWQIQQEAAGYTNLTSVPGRYSVGEKSDYVVRWHRAIASVVAGDLADRQHAQSVRSSGVERAEELAADTDIHRRNVTYAVRDFLGRTRIIAEVI